MCWRDRVGILNFISALLLKSQNPHPVFPKPGKTRMGHPTEQGTPACVSIPRFCVPRWDAFQGAGAAPAPDSATINSGSAGFISLHASRYCPYGDLLDPGLMHRHLRFSTIATGKTYHVSSGKM